MLDSEIFKTHNVVSNIVKKMDEEFQKSFEDKTELISLLNDKDKTKYNQKVHEYVIKNHDKYINQYKQNLKKYGIKIIFINFKKYK